MTRNEEKQPGKLKSLEISGRKGRPWRERLFAEKLLSPRVAGWAINILMALAIVFISSHPADKPLQNVYTPPAREGDPVIAVRDLKIPRDIEVPDEDGSNKNRVEAESRTRSIYDFDPSVQNTINKQVTAFFEGFREIYPPGYLSSVMEGSTETQMPITVPLTFKEEAEQKLLREFRDLGVNLTPEDLDVLKKNGFEKDVEKAVQGLVADVYQNKKGERRYMVANKDLLLKDREKGINAYSINAEANTPPLEISNLEQVLDLNSAKDLIDQNARERLEGMNQATRQVAAKIAKSLLDPNLTFNKNKTEEAKAAAVASVKPLYYKFKKGEVIVREGDRLSPEQRTKVDAILAAQKTIIPRSFRNLGMLILTLVLVSWLTAFSMRNIRKFQVSTKDLAFLAVVLVASLGALKGVEFMARSAQASLSESPEGLNFYYLIPLAGAAMLVRMVLNSEVALIFSICLAVLGGLVADNSLLFGIYTLVGSLVSAGEVRQCRQRSTILRAGLVLGLVNAFMILVISAVTNAFLDPNDFLPRGSLMYNALFGLFGGVFIAIVVTGLVPVAEWMFGYATDIKLLELLNQDHALLKDLSMRAPGTHQHSLMVANLGEGAAKSIGANPLLARVCAMYHDLGKMNKPMYFAENQWDGTNIHDRLSPSMSTLIIHNHVKEGVELGEKHKLPRVVLNSIQQHHGTSLVKFFYEKAKELNDTGMTVEETDFRYAGPKPQTRETAIIMLSDVVESAARSLRDPSPAQLQGMVQKQINRFFIDGQLDECDLTLKDLHQIARSFNTTLGAVYHHRPDYPQPVVKGQAAEKKKKAEQNGAGPKDKAQAKDKDEQKKSEEKDEDTLKRLGMS